MTWCISEPGGYLQWDDFDFEQVVTIGPPAPMHQELHDITKHFFSGLGMSIQCSLNVLDGMRQAGLEGVVGEERNSYWYESLSPDAQRWACISYSGCVGKALMWSGKVKDEETAVKIMNEKLEVLEKEYQSGVVPNFPQRVIVGRKPI
ncbi:hypothetical protein EG329_007193 [Mollisiaceae sp. DMI_Dod_QoI]|nr:hypothetical protein EG329_007193 [Helotiales sp. DMI_Dod_QoI]